MGLQIEDGQGHGRLAAVTPDNALRVESTTGEERAVFDGHAFTLSAECHLAAAVSGGLMVFTNTSKIFDVFITRIFFDAHVLTTNIFVKEVFDAVISNGTDISITGIINKHRGSGFTVDGDLIISDGASDMTFTGGVQIASFPLLTLTSSLRDTRAIRLPNNTSLLLGWEAVSGSATDGEIISISANGFVEEKANIPE